MSLHRQPLPGSSMVLLLIDFINPLDFPGAQDLAPAALEAARATARLKAQLRKAGVPAVYANDNYGEWQSDFNSMVTHLRAARGPAAEMARLLYPQPHDLTILKPRHSAFHASPLGLLLREMRATQLVITGVATDICVQFTAMDAYLRGFRIHVPSDCVAAESADDHKQALRYMQRVLKCEVAPSAFVRPPAKTAVAAKRAKPPAAPHDED